MKTPIVDFARLYAGKDPVRMHMPGHKGIKALGPEPLDLTEIEGADELYAPTGIIAESERNASALFGCPTFYSTEGSSLCVKAMLLLALRHSGEKRPLILAARNVHRSFLDAAVLLDFEISWMYGKEQSTCLSCTLTAEEAEEAIKNAPRKPAAVYLTSPDYPGHLADIEGIAQVCRRHRILLLVDNAHGAYLKFLTPSRHPIDLGADLSCDSAHKTLPVLTGGAYLHLSPERRELTPFVKEALSLFGSTSPSYLILQSLDLANRYLEDHRERLTRFLPLVSAWKEALRAAGYELIGSEPLKATLRANAYGYEGTALAARLREKGIFCEFCDRGIVVLMVSPEQTGEELDRVLSVLREIPRLEPIAGETCPLPRPAQILTPREAMLGGREKRPLDDCKGKVYADLCVSCPPAVPPVVCGEKLDAETIAVLRAYGITECWVASEEKPPLF